MTDAATLYLQKFAINEACSRQRQVIIALFKLQNHGITEDRILYLNNSLENGSNTDMKSRDESDHYTNAK